MSITVNKKHNGSIWLVQNVTIILLFVFSISTWGTEQSTSNRASADEAGIESISLEMQSLSESINNSSGDELEALRLQLFQKNQELRGKLSAAIKNSSVPHKKLITLVNFQKKYSDGNLLYLEQKIQAISEEINNATAETKLTLVNNYRELQQYLIVALESRWQNLIWLEQLGVPLSKEVDTFKVSLDKRLQLLSASIVYLNQQSNLIRSQVSSSPESERAPLQLALLILDHRLNIATDSLDKFISLADKTGLDNSEYKRQYFEVTGSITYDLLDIDVALSIIKNWSSYSFSWVVENAPQYIFQLLVFILILAVTSRLSKLARKLVGKTVTSKNLKLSQLMQEFFISMSGKAIWFLGFMIALSQLGLNMAPILTGFGVAGVIIGFALQDTLSNFAAGMMLLIYRPFDVGDFVYAGGVDGKVSHMSLVNTTIRTFDNQIIIVPNSKIWGDVIKNVTHERVRRVDMVFGIGYSDDLLKAELVLNDIITSHPSVLRTPEPVIKVHILNTSSVDFIVRPWVKTDDYWDVYWDVTKEVKLRFDNEGISIPYPQQDVHLHIPENQVWEKRMK